MKRCTIVVAVMLAMAGCVSTDGDGSGGTAGAGGAGGSAADDAGIMVDAGGFGGSGGAMADAGQGGMDIDGGAGGVIIDGGSGGMDIDGGAGGVIIDGGSGGVEIDGGEPGEVGVDGGEPEEVGVDGGEPEEVGVDADVEDEGVDAGACLGSCFSNLECGEGTICINQTPDGELEEPCCVAGERGEAAPGEDCSEGDGQYICATSICVSGNVNGEDVSLCSTPCDTEEDCPANMQRCMLLIVEEGFEQAWCFPH